MDVNEVNLVYREEKNRILAPYRSDKGGVASSLAPQSRRVCQGKVAQRPYLNLLTPTLPCHYLSVMAFSGQISWQQKQVMQVSASTSGRWPFIDKADTGH